MRKLSITRLLFSGRWWAAIVVLASAGAAQAQIGYTFQSPALDEASCGATISFATAFADGNWSFIGASAPAGFSYYISDGYTTDTVLTDLSSLNFTSSAGALSNIAITVVDTASPYDPYYGYTSFYAGPASTQLQDASDPGIVGLDYAGHHVPVVNGGAGTWALSVAAVPEPSTDVLVAAGLTVMGFAARRRKKNAENAPRPVRPWPCVFRWPSSVTLHSAGGNLLEGTTVDGREVKLGRRRWASQPRFR